MARGKQPDKSPIHFAVPLCLFERQQDPTFFIPSATSLFSLARQTHRHWNVIVVGDGLVPRARRRVENIIGQSGIPPGQVNFTNCCPRRHLDLATHALPLGSAPGSTFSEHCPDRNTSGNVCHAFAGNQCWNTALDYIKHHRGQATHVAWLDDDDMWHNNHLELLASAYSQVPSAKFAYTYSLGRWGTKFTAPTRIPAPRQRCYPRRCTMRIVKMPPLPCYMVHSSASWSLDSPVAQLRYRYFSEQLHVVRNVSKAMAFARMWPLYPQQCRCQSVCPEVYHCAKRHACKNSYSSAVMGNDADMWDRVWDMVANDQLVSIFVPRRTVRYTRVYVAKLLPLLTELTQMQGSLGTIDTEEVEFANATSPALQSVWPEQRMQQSEVNRCNKVSS